MKLYGTEDDYLSRAHARRGPCPSWETRIIYAVNPADHCSARSDYLINALNVFRRAIKSIARELDVTRASRLNPLYSR